MRIFITGASGFAGGYLIRHLLESRSDLQIVGTVPPGRSFPETPDPRLRFVSCDIVARHGLMIDEAVGSAGPDQLYHLAGAASAAAPDRDRVFQANVEGTRFVMRAARHHMPAGRILFASTGYVYGPGDPARPAREEDPFAPAGLYGAYADSKREAEIEARAAGAIVTRAFNHTGPGQTTAFAVPAFAMQIARIEQGASLPVIQVGNLEARRDFLDVRDVVRAYCLLMAQGIPGEAHNVCSGQARVMSDVLRELLSLSRLPISVLEDPDRKRRSEIACSVGDPRRLQALTGWKPQVPFGQMLQDTLDWWRRRP